MALDEQISELLYHYDCVIVPEFGGFITNYKAAHLDRRLHLFHPPSKEVSFNQNLKRNDGLLANYLSDIRSCSFETANEIIRQEVEAYFTRLNNGERVIFRKVGILYKDSNSNLRFQPSHEQNFLKDAFGLEKMFVAPLDAPISEPTEQVETQEKVEATPVIPLSVQSENAASKELDQDQQSERKWQVRVAWAAAIALPVVAYGAWLLATTDVGRSGNLTIADLNPFRNGSIAHYEARSSAESWGETEQTDSDRLTEQLHDAEEARVKISFTDPEGEGVYVRLKEIEKKPAPPVNTYVATPELLALRYHVVGGCFSELSNARGWVDELRSRGYNAYILDQHKGLYRVTFGNFERRSAAVDALKRIKREELDSAWLLIR